MFKKIRQILVRSSYLLLNLTQTFENFNQGFPNLSTDIVEQLYIKLIILHVIPNAGEEELVVHDADVWVLTVHHLYCQEDVGVSLEPATVGGW